MTIDPIWSPEIQQRLFRRLFTAMARPGTILDLSDLLNREQAWKAVLATLVDGTVQLSDPNGMLDAPSWRLMQAVACSPEKAVYIVAEGASGPDFEPSLGTLDSPEFGSTILITVSRIGGSAGQCLTSRGPGIEHSQDLSVEGLHPQWLSRRKKWNACFPLGVDFLLADHRRIAALPRTTQLTVKGV